MNVTNEQDSNAAEDKNESSHNSPDSKYSEVDTHMVSIENMSLKENSEEEVFYYYDSNDEIDCYTVKMINEKDNTEPKITVTKRKSIKDLDPGITLKAIIRLSEETPLWNYAIASKSILGMTSNLPIDEYEEPQYMIALDLLDQNNFARKKKIIQTSKQALNTTSRDGLKVVIPNIIFRENRIFGYRFWDIGYRLVMDLDHIKCLEFGSESKIGKKSLNMMKNHCATIRYLNLRDCCVENAKDFDQAISQLKFLKCLDLGRIFNLQTSSLGFGDNTLKLICESCPGIMKIVLWSWGRLTDEGAIHLTQLKDLKMLSLRYCGEIGDKALEELAKLTNLEYMDLRYCRNVRDLGLKSIFEGCGKLKNIDIFGAGATMDFKSNVRRQYPNINITD